MINWCDKQCAATEYYFMINCVLLSSAIISPHLLLIILPQTILCWSRTTPWLRAHGQHHRNTHNWTHCYTSNFQLTAVSKLPHRTCKLNNKASFQMTMYIYGCLFFASSSSIQDNWGKCDDILAFGSGYCWLLPPTEICYDWLYPGMVAAGCNVWLQQSAAPRNFD